MIAVGVLSRKLHIVKEGFDRQLSAFIINITLPCLIIKSMSIPFQARDLFNSGVLLLLAAAVLVIELIIGQVIYAVSRKSSFGRIARFSVLFSNFNFVGIAVIQTLCNEQGLFYYLIFIIPIRICYFSFAKRLLVPSEVQLPTLSLKEKLMGWFSAPTLAVVVGLIFYITNFRLPSVLANVVNSVGGLCSPLGLILCGMVLGNFQFFKLVQKNGLLVAVFRNLIVPGFIYGLTRLFGLDATFQQITVLYSATPVAALLATFIVQYDPDENAHLEAAGSFLMSTFLSIVTLPFWAYVLFR
jgi:predicted permease